MKLDCEICTMLWGCDDPAEGTLHEQWDATDVKEDEHRLLIDSLEEARARGRAATRAARESEELPPPGSTTESELFAGLRHFAISRASDGGPELKLFDATGANIAPSASSVELLLEPSNPDRVGVITDGQIFDWSADRFVVWQNSRKCSHSLLGFSAVV